MDFDPSIMLRLKGHSTSINCVTFNPRENTLASGDDKNVIMVWNLKKDTRSIKLLGHKGAVYDLSFSPRSNLLASASQDRTVKLWTPNYTARHSDITAHNSAVRSVNFNPDGDKIVTGSDDKSVKLWNVENSRRFLHSMTQHTNWVRCTRFSDNGNVIGSCGDDCTAILWDIREPKRSVHTLSGLDSATRCIQFAPNSDTSFALGFVTGHVRIFDIRSPQHLLQVYIHDKNVHANQISFHPSGKILLVAYADGITKIFDLLEGRPMFTLTNEGKTAVKGAAFNKSGNLFATAGDDKQVTVWKASPNCMSPRTPMSLRSHLTAGSNRTPVSGDPRSPMPPQHARRPLMNKELSNDENAVNGHSNEEFNVLEDRVRRLELLLLEKNISLPGPSGDMNLEKRISILENHAINDNLNNDDIGSETQV